MAPSNWKEAGPVAARANSGFFDRAALLPEVARRLFGEPPMKNGGDTWRYGSDESLELHVGGPRRGTWYDHKAGNGGDTLDLVKHVLLLRDETNAIRWLKAQGLIRRRLDLRRPTMTAARQWLVETEDNPFTTDADRVAALDAQTSRNTDGPRWWWQFPDGSVVERLDTDTWQPV